MYVSANIEPHMTSFLYYYYHYYYLLFIYYVIIQRAIGVTWLFNVLYLRDLRESTLVESQKLWQK